MFAWLTRIISENCRDNQKNYCHHADGYFFFAIIFFENVTKQKKKSSWLKNIQIISLSKLYVILINIILRT